jgi:hypothetical protein
LPKEGDFYIIPSTESEIPKPPGDPTIVEYKTTSLRLRWLPSPSDANHYIAADRDVDSQSNITYIIEYRTAKSYAWASYASNVEQLTCFVDNLTPGLTYSFRVRAENATGISEPSGVVSTKNMKDDSSNDTKKTEPLKEKNGVGMKQKLIMI